MEKHSSDLSWKRTLLIFIVSWLVPVQILGILRSIKHGFWIWPPECRSRISVCESLTNSISRIPTGCESINLHSNKVPTDKRLVPSVVPFVYRPELDTNVQVVPAGYMRIFECFRQRALVIYGLWFASSVYWGEIEGNRLHGDSADKELSISIKVT